MDPEPTPYMPIWHSMWELAPDAAIRVLQDHPLAAKCCASIATTKDDLCGVCLYRLHRLAHEAAQVKHGKPPEHQHEAERRGPIKKPYVPKVDRPRKKLRTMKTKRHPWPYPEPAPGSPKHSTKKPALFESPSKRVIVQILL